MPLKGNIGTRVEWVSDWIDQDDNNNNNNLNEILDCCNQASTEGREGIVQLKYAISVNL